LDKNPGCPEGTLIGTFNGANAEQQCWDFLGNYPNCPHCTEGESWRMLGRLVGYDQSDADANSEVRPVFVLDCASGGIVATTQRASARLVGYDEGLPVFGVDVQGKADDQIAVYKARLIGYDSGDNYGLPTLPVYGLVPTCLNPCLQFLCGHTVCGCPLPKTVCLNLDGTDSGVVQLTRTTNQYLPIGLTTNPPCLLTGGINLPFGDNPCVWAGCFQSILGFTVYVILDEAANFSGEVCASNSYVLWFLFPCGGDQYRCGNWAWSVACITDFICPGMPGGMSLSFGVGGGRCEALPGVGWGGTITDADCCAGEQWYACRPSGGSATCVQGLGCPGCDGLAAGPFCSQCQCTDYLAHT